MKTIKLNRIGYTLSGDNEEVPGKEVEELAEALEGLGLYELPQITLNNLGKVELGIPVVFAGKAIDVGTYLSAVRQAGFTMVPWKVLEVERKPVKKNPPEQVNDTNAGSGWIEQAIWQKYQWLPPIGQPKKPLTAQEIIAMMMPLVPKVPNANS